MTQFVPESVFQQDNEQIKCHLVTWLKRFKFSAESSVSLTLGKTCDQSKSFLKKIYFHSSSSASQACSLLLGKFDVVCVLGLISD